MRSPKDILLCVAAISMLLCPFCLSASYAAIDTSTPPITPDCTGTLCESSTDMAPAKDSGQSVAPCPTCPTARSRTVTHKRTFRSSGCYRARAFNSCRRAPVARAGAAVVRGTLRVATAPIRLVAKVVSNVVERRQSRRAARRSARCCN